MEQDMPALKGFAVQWIFKVINRKMSKLNYVCSTACTPGQTFTASDGCNTCHCNEEGTNAVCTLKACISNPNNPNYAATTYRRKRDEGCTPKSTFTAPDGCNTCRCSDDGKTSFCTRMECPPTPQEATPYRRKRDLKCTPGNVFMAEDGCNSCICNDDGTNAACTERACITNPEYAPMPYRRKRDEGCVPKSSFTAPDGCNTCRCSDDGKHSFCTRMECPPKAQEATPYRKRRDLGN
uniref:Pacifastin domain-containing protein n=1 Tax=Phlebotomus papatasi TaxID=29031 RepID=A0A1B0DFD1_PHLPP